MRKSSIATLGVTLLEVLLVLVIASFVLVMSVRYYQSASQNSKVNAALASLQSGMAGVDAYINAGQPLSNAVSTGANTDSLAPYLSGGALSNPWGGTTGIQGSTGSYTVTFNNVPNDACIKFVALAQQNNKVTAPACTAGSNNIVFTVTP